jgi:LysR family cyn operon transcriptional activator
MELRQLKYFVKVAETLNFSEASKALNITQSTLSQQIRQLEDEIGTQLFVRSSHHVLLTEAGVELLPCANKTLRDAQLCLSRINDLNELLTGTLSIGVTYTFGPILTEALFSFMKMYPKIKLNIVYKPMTDLLVLLRNREVDFVLAFRPSKAVEGIESHMLFQNCLSAIVGDGHPLAENKSVTLAELENYDLALPSRGLQARNMLDKILSRRPYNFRVRIELNEANILLKLIRQNKLVTILAEATIHNESGVKAIPIDIPDNEMIGCVHTLKDSYRKRAMLEFIKILSASNAVRERQNAWL